MLYLIFIAIIAFIIVLAISMDDSEIGWLSGILIVIFVAWTICGGYKCITQPVYESKIVEKASIPELATIKNNRGIYDVIYADRDKKIVYIDSDVAKSGRAEVYNSEGELIVEVYELTPKTTFIKSVNILFNHKTLYKVYIPEGYTVRTELKIE